MSEMRTMVRTHVAVNDVGFTLASGQDVDALKEEIVSAARSGPRFVEFAVVGDRSVSVLMSAATQIVISVETIPVDHRDDLQDIVPFGSAYDLL
ncbi:hypothetical protein [Microbacterium sp. EST19A]|uniref:hypothetical protein n=1 Tax=Microbacterium sp. EST19A TaxID=2862681 RepID=UPI001CBAC999|nr:hypothetical protein [Microbacterium sp. EST19A]